MNLRFQFCSEAEVLMPDGSIRAGLKIHCKPNVLQDGESLGAPLAWHKQFCWYMLISIAEKMSWLTLPFGVIL